jgi:ATP-binding cassette subfamily B protein
MFAGGHRGLLESETSKPKRTGETLARFGTYFKPFWFILVITTILVVTSTWAQVTSPELIGQLVDCYLSPASAALGVNPPGAEQTSSQSNCWLSAGQEPQGLTQRVIKTLFTAGNFPAPDTTAPMTEAERIAGLGRLVLLLIGLFVSGAILTGLTFYSMTWAGQHVLRTLRTDVFQHLHRLHTGYYAEQEVGDLMSRITNDTETIGQALNFALVNVVSGTLLLIWIGYNMLSKSLSFALISMAVVPVMAVTTVWFSSQARKAFRKTRKEIGNVNAELQESISAVREVQAFNRSDENIENFRLVNAANRDANVRAVAFTSALAPSLEALGYIALMIVSVVGVGPVGDTCFRHNGFDWLVITSSGMSSDPTSRSADLGLDQHPERYRWWGAHFRLAMSSPASRRPRHPSMPPIQGKVELDHVQAEYKAGQPVLNGISFTAEPGQTVAIVGPTGAGKTTIINLIPRFYDVTGGAVLIDGIDVRNVTIESLRKQIGVVLQDTFMFSTSVMENIRFGAGSDR